MNIQHRSVKDLLTKSGYTPVSVTKLPQGEKGGRPSVAYDLSDDDIVRLVGSSRSVTPEKLKKISDLTGISMLTISQVAVSRSESVLLDCVVELFSVVDGAKVTPQMRVMGYNVDIAVSCGKSILLIECDERHHSHPVTIIEDNKRQEEIINALECDYDHIVMMRVNHDEIAIGVARIANIINTDSFAPIVLNCAIGGYMPPQAIEIWKED